MKIFHLSAADVYGGGEEHIRTLLAAMSLQQKEGEELALVAPENAPLTEKCLALGIRCIPFDFGGKKDPLAAIRLRKLIKEEKADIIHSHNRREDLAAILGHGKAKVFTTLHDRINMTQSGERSTTFFDRVYLRLLPRFDKILTVSEATLKDYQDLSGDQRDSNSFITNGMDLSRLEGITEDLSFRKTHNIDENALLIIMSARVRKGSFGKKGHLRILDILEKVTAPIHFLTVGEDEESSKLLQSEAEKRSVKITTLGFQTAAMQIIRQADLVVLPSLFEGLPRALMEAMALGRAVLGSDVDGIRALTNNGQAGLILPLADQDAWIKTIDDLASDSERRNTLGEAAAQFIKENYSSAKMATEHWEIYRKTP
jgi:glycosyltransferase involved in cell wall biosynthesis